jgi:hypothetical protein
LVPKTKLIKETHAGRGRGRECVEVGGREWSKMECLAPQASKHGGASLLLWVELVVVVTNAWGVDSNRWVYSFDPISWRGFVLVNGGVSTRRWLVAKQNEGGNSQLNAYVLKIFLNVKK